MDDTPIAPLEDDEATLRRFVKGSVSLSDGALARLARQGLIEIEGHAARLTPLGRRKFRSLPKATLQVPFPGDPIEAVLAKYTARFQSAHAVATPRVETRGRPPRHLPVEMVMAPILLFDGHEALIQARAYSTRIRETMRYQRAKDGVRITNSKACLAASRVSLARSADIFKVA